MLSVGVIRPRQLVSSMSRLIASDFLLSQADWSLQYVDSEELVGVDGAATNAFDGNSATIWHTEWLNSNPPPPHEIQLDLGSAYEIFALHYLPRQDGVTNGIMTEYEVYVSRDGDRLGCSRSDRHTCWR